MTQPKLIAFSSDYADKVDMVELMKIYQRDNNTNLRLNVQSVAGGVFVNIRDHNGKPIYLTHERTEFHKPILSFRENSQEDFYSLLLKLDLIFSHLPGVCEEQGCSPLTNAIGQRLLPSPTNFGSAA